MTDDFDIPWPDLPHRNSFRQRDPTSVKTTAAIICGFVVGSLIAMGTACWFFN